MWTFVHLYSSIFVCIRLYLVKFESYGGILICIYNYARATAPADPHLHQAGNMLTSSLSVLPLNASLG
jgi:hypothetical protein